MHRTRIIALLFLIAIGLMTWMLFKQKPLYRASSVVIINSLSQDILALKDIVKSGRAYYFAYTAYIEMQQEIIKSRRVAYHVIKNLELKNNKASGVTKDDIGNLLKKLKTVNVKNTGIIRIIAEGEDPKETSRIANEFARVYVNHSLSQIELNSARVQDFADIPIEPVRPNKKLNIIVSIMLVITFGINITLLRKPGNVTIKDSNDIGVWLQLPILGSVPQIKTGGKNIKTRLDISRVVEKDPLSIAYDAYRLIRGKLLFSLDNPSSITKSIVITSSVPKEGKTTSAVNLAIMTAHSGERALLVDAHMRRPSVHNVFNMNNGAGFSDYLSGSADFDTIVRYPGIDNLAIITSGKKQHKLVKYIYLKNMRFFLERAGARFSKIIFDVPPLIFLTDMEALLNICDGVILIAGTNNAAKNLLNNSKKSLHEKGVNIIGVILNKVSF